MARKDGHRFNDTRGNRKPEGTPILRSSVEEIAARMKGTTYGSTQRPKGAGKQPR